MAQCNVQSLLDDAKCFACLPPGLWAVLELQLLCEIVSAGGTGGGSATVGSGSPQGVVSASPGQFYWDTTNQILYIKDTGTGNTGWQQVA